MKIFNKFFPGKETRERNALEINFSDEFIWLNSPVKSGKKMPWDEIEEIRAIVAKDQAEITYLTIRLKSESEEIDVPRGCKGYKAFRARLYKLNDFTSANYSQALECDDPQHFILWRKVKNEVEPRFKSHKTA